MSKLGIAKYTINGHITSQLFFEHFLFVNSKDVGDTNSLIFSSLKIKYVLISL